ncbi:MAG: hypothetical protein GX221_02130 [Candidatus Riflebacteria bacterium]|nr:hypothetical protein [Candidatus Riflebacteria bacterium]
MHAKHILESWVGCIFFIALAIYNAVGVIKAFLNGAIIVSGKNTPDRIYTRLESPMSFGMFVFFTLVRGCFLLDIISCDVC